MVSFQYKTPHRWVGVGLWTEILNPALAEKEEQAL